MKSFLIAIVSLVIGGIAGGLVALSVGTGIGAGAGIATGLAAGACSALETAQEKGLVTEAQFDEIMSGAVAKISGDLELPPGADVANTAAECQKVMAELKKASASE